MDPVSNLLLFKYLKDLNIVNREVLYIVLDADSACLFSTVNPEEAEGGGGTGSPDRFLHLMPSRCVG